MKKGKGLIFATGHLGNWELLAHGLVRHGYPVSAVAKESYDHRFTALIEASRGRLGYESIFRSAAGASGAILRALRSGRVLGVLIDQDTRAPSVFVPFFGRLAATPSGAATLALRTGAPIVAGAIHRTVSGDHVIEVEACETLGTVDEITAQITILLERWIRRRPSQWVWLHRRWKTRPDGHHQEAA